MALSRISAASAATRPGRLARRTFLAKTAIAGASLLIPRPNTSRAADDNPLRIDTPLDRLVPEIEAAVREAMTEHKVPGLSIALLRDGQTVWSGGFGLMDQESGQRVDDETVFEAASLTKPVTAYAALCLVEQGRLDLDKSLSEYLEEPYADDKSGFLPRVTARHVLTHTTGLPNWLGGKTARFLSKPGYKFGYSGEGFVYLQRAIEHLTESPLDAYLKEQLFEPLGMASSSLTWRDDYQQRLAKGYMPALKRGIRRKQAEPNAASSLVCTPADYARFVQRLLERPAPRARGIVLADVAPMWKPAVDAAEGISWGLGIGIEHTPQGDAFWHWGNNGGMYNAFVVGYPRERLALVVLTNGGTGLKACTTIVPVGIGGDHPALRWSKVVG